MIFHPVSTEHELSREQARVLVSALVKSGKKFVVIESINDLGSKAIRKIFDGFESNASFRTLPLMRFEYFQVLLGNADFIVENSSSGVREAPHYGVPAINMGSRQTGLVTSNLVLNCDFVPSEILASIEKALVIHRSAESNFGSGESAKL